MEVVTQGHEFDCKGPAEQPSPNVEVNRPCGRVQDRSEEDFEVTTHELSVAIQPFSLKVGVN